MKNKTIHRAFKMEYPVRVNELITPVSIKGCLNDKVDTFKQFQAVWDTGASSTVISDKVVKLLQLIPTGKCEVLGVNSSEIKDTFIIDILLPNKVLIKNVNVNESDLNSEGIDVLIGMDIIQLGDFAIANANNKTTFSYCIPPHKNPIDLYSKSLSVNPKK